MKFANCKLVHWIAAMVIGMGSIAPSISQAISLVKGGDALVMEICSANGGKLQINVEIVSHEGNAAELGEHCSSCLAHSSIVPTFNTNLKLQAPQTLALLPRLFYQSPQPLAVWITPPSAAPPAKA